jgi:hypothetical protein
VEPFESCWQRIDRAAVHSAEAAKVWNGYLEGHPFETNLVHEGNGVHVMYVDQTEPTPPEMSVLIGEWAYNLRAALDYTVYETAVVTSGQRPPPGAGELQFPVFESKESFDKSRGRFRAFRDHHVDLLETMQPYRHDDPDTSALRWLNRVAREDRHRQLSVFTAYAAELRPRIGLTPGHTADLTFGARSLRDGSAEVFRFVVRPWSVDVEVEVNPRIGLDPDIEGWAESAFWGRIAYNERLAIVASVPKSMVVTFEYDCLGSTREPDWLTDSFRAECDERRPSWRPNA